MLYNLLLPESLSLAQQLDRVRHDPRGDDAGMGARIRGQQEGELIAERVLAEEGPL